MTTDKPHPDREKLLPLAILSLVVGAATGFVGALFRLCLDEATHLRDALVAWAQLEGPLGLIAVVAACALSTAVAAWLVRRFAPAPLAAASLTPKLCLTAICHPRRSF